MLSGARDVTYIHEPFNILHRPGICDVRFANWFPYVSRDNEHVYMAPIREMLEFRYKTAAEVRAMRSARDVGRFLRDWARFLRSRRRDARPLVKDPIALFSAEWLWESFDMAPVVMVRHPAAFASSLKRLQWSHPFKDFLDQPLLMRDLLSPFERDVREFASRDHPILDQSILLWKLIHHTIAIYRDRHPDWLFVRHEDLARDPIRGFAQIFDRLGLCFDETAKSQIRAHSDPSNPIEVAEAGVVKRDSRSSIWTWKSRLTDDEIERVRDGVRTIATQFYADADW